MIDAYLIDPLLNRTLGKAADNPLISGLARKALGLVSIPGQGLLSQIPFNLESTSTLSAGGASGQVSVEQVVTTGLAAQVLQQATEKGLPAEYLSGPSAIKQAIISIHGEEFASNLTNEQLLGVFQAIQTFPVEALPDSDGGISGMGNTADLRAVVQNITLKLKSRVLLFVNKKICFIISHRTLVL